MADDGACFGFVSGDKGFGFALKNFANTALSAAAGGTITGFDLPTCIGFTVAMTLPQRDFSVLSRGRAIPVLKTKPGDCSLRQKNQCRTAR